MPKQTKSDEDEARAAKQARQAEAAEAAEREEQDRLEAERQKAEDEANAVEAQEPGSAPGPAVVLGPTGTTVDPNDPGLGKLRVEVNSNISLGNEVLTPTQKVEVVDTPEVRSIIAVGHLRLLDDDEQLDSE
jgi:hypothetical protein